jgi:hypothetical protein
MHTMGLFFYFPFPSPTCALHEADNLEQRGEEGDGGADREAARERQRQRECAPVRARGCRSTWYLCPP